MKIIDFGFARLRPQSPAGPMQTPCFTLQYAAPELLAQQGYDESCDLWSLGVILVWDGAPGRVQGAWSPRSEGFLMWSSRDTPQAEYRGPLGGGGRVAQSLGSGPPSPRDQKSGFSITHGPQEPPTWRAPPGPSWLCSQGRFSTPPLPTSPVHDAVGAGPLPGGLRPGWAEPGGRDHVQDS